MLMRMFLQKNEFFNRNEMKKLVFANVERAKGGKCITIVSTRKHNS